MTKDRAWAPVDKILTFLALVGIAIVSFIIVVYLDPAPNLKEIDCGAGKISVFARDGRHCVKTTKPGD